MTTEPSRILVFVPNWLGDVVMATPALRAIRSQYPKAHIRVVGRAGAIALLSDGPWNFELVPVAEGGLKAFIGAARRLRAAGPWDLAVIFPHSFRSALLASLAGAKVRVGYARDGRGILLNRALQPVRENGKVSPVYMAREYLALVAAVGCSDDGSGLELGVADEALARIRPHIAGDGPVVGFAPGAAFGPSKRWPAERYAAVADRLRESVGARCVLLTGPGEEDTRAAVQSGAKTPLLECDEGAPTIATLKATITGLDLLVCNDSGPRHVAVAFGVPTVCIMGSTKPAYSCGPYEKGEVLRVDVDCGPCQKPVCTTDHRCMTGVGVEWVAETALRILTNASAAGVRV